MDPKKSPSADVHLKRPLLFSFSMVISLSLTIAAFEWESESDDRKVTKTLAIQDVEEMLEIPPTDQPPPPPKRIQQPNIIEVPDEEALIEDIPPILDLETFTEEPVEQIAVVHEPEEAETGDEIFLIVESPAEFIGGQTALNKFIVENIRYPARASRMGIQGRVYVKAVIEKDGSVTNAEVIKGISMDCDKEAERVVGLLPKWKPGKQRGKAVRTSIIVPIIFTTEN
jgi:periplasmic protein TonB